MVIWNIPYYNKSAVKILYKDENTVDDSEANDIVLSCCGIFVVLLFWYACIYYHELM